MRYSVGKTRRIDVERVFDGKALTFLGKNENVDIQVAVPGTIDNLVDAMRNQYHRPAP
jgi:hypothetical protein